jgi:hypothetical protein
MALNKPEVGLFTLLGAARPAHVDQQHVSLYAV